MATSAASLKPLKIKTGTCRRVLKKLKSYEKEVERESAKTASMRESGADPFDLKQQENVLFESRMMVPETRKRLEAALGDLEAILAEAEEDELMAGTRYFTSGFNGSNHGIFFRGERIFVVNGNVNFKNESSLYSLREIEESN